MILFLRAEQLRSPNSRRDDWNKREQVAAVCFRLKRTDVEFLLVRTGSGRWTFPKGCTEPGLTRAQAAALEAFEEAGVHGRIEENSFARYFYRKRRARRSESTARELIVHAHLCEVTNAGRPEESDRKPKWFAAGKAKRRLRERRGDQDGAELSRIIDLAVVRVQSVRTHRLSDGLQRVRFDAFDVAGTPATLQRRAIGRYLRRGQITQADSALNIPLTRAQGLLTGKVVPLKIKKT